jgi:hypothetical protein
MDDETPQRSVPVTPNHLWILDTENGVSGTHAAHFTPHGYQCTIHISPVVVTELLKWSYRNGYILVDGHITYLKDRSRRRLRRNG